MEVYPNILWFTDFATFVSSEILVLRNRKARKSAFQVYQYFVTKRRQARHLILRNSCFNITRSLTFFNYFTESIDPV